MKKYILVFLCFNMSKNILTMNDLGELVFKVNASCFISTIAGFLSAKFLKENNLVEGENTLIPAACVFGITSILLTRRIIRSEQSNFEKKKIQKEIEKIDTIPNNNDAVKYINANHFLPAFPNSNDEEIIVNPLSLLTHSYILGKENDMLKIVVIPNANKTQNEEEVKNSAPNALLQLLIERRERINIICEQNTNFFNFLQPQDERIYIFYQKDNKNVKSIKP